MTDHSVMFCIVFFVNFLFLRKKSRKKHISKRNRKGTVDTKILNTHDLLIFEPAYVYMTFFFQMNTIGVILKNILALPSFVMAVNGC